MLWVGEGKVTADPKACAASKLAGTGAFVMVDHMELTAFLAASSNCSRNEQA